MANCKDCVHVKKTGNTTFCSTKQKVLLFDRADSCDDYKDMIFAS